MLYIIIYHNLDSLKTLIYIIYVYVYYICVYICFKALQSTNKPSTIDASRLLYVIVCGFQERMQSFQKLSKI